MNLDIFRLVATDGSAQERTDVITALMREPFMPKHLQPPVPCHGVSPFAMVVLCVLARLLVLVVIKDATDFLNILASVKFVGAHRRQSRLWNLPCCNRVLELIVLDAEFPSGFTRSQNF